MSETLGERLSLVEEMVMSHDKVLMGEWDKEKTKRVPGILEQMTLLTNIMKYGVIPLMVLDTLIQLGLKDMIPNLVKILIEASH